MSAFPFADLWAEAGARDRALLVTIAGLDLDLIFFSWWEIHHLDRTLIQTRTADLREWLNRKLPAAAPAAAAVALQVAA